MELIAHWSLARAPAMSIGAGDGKLLDELGVRADGERNIGTYFIGGNDMSGAYTALGALVIGAGMKITHKNPYSLSDAKGVIGLGPPKPLGPPPLMPDQTSVLQAAQLQESKYASLQFGRAATVLTGTGTAGAQTTGDKLGP